ncbi:MAG: hypothetical protein LBN27_13935 [Prevotellaceae bacterium]|nr:hypothetical protein [Prevotellaceae bacterium]
MRSIKPIILSLFIGILPLQAQEEEAIALSEIVISTKAGIDRNQLAKPNGTLDEYLSEKIDMVKRGNYAWEPSINNMTSERISVTIDGMKIFNACTDRMDPVTSYVETVNLSKAVICSGFDGSDPNASNCIGGSLDLKLNKAGFCQDGFSANANAGYENNGNLWIYGADAAYASPQFYVNSGIFHRSSGNYYAGGGKEVPFSQFTKNNVFANLGYLPKTGKALEGSFIYDRADNVGYPALAMDVRKAEGLITSLAYTAENPLPYFYKWENKIYYNNIVHIMDDTHRPDVPVRMDMPGKSRTGGFYSTLHGRNGKHRYSFNFDGYYNQSYAEMTMYPRNSGELPMFMLTWGDIRTANSGLFGVDEWRITENHSVRLSGKLSLQRAGVQSRFGWETLQGYYPDMERFDNRLTGNLSARYTFRKDAWETAAGAGYGNRAPSVSEAYGFYLFNTFDSYDYIGNPHLKNESSTSGDVLLKYRKGSFEAKAEVSYFYFHNYIIGKPAADLYRMTIGASGVKVYQNLPNASLWNSSVSAKYGFLEYFTLSGKATYARGRDNAGGNLPLIAPLSYNASLSFSRNRFYAEAGIAGAARQTDFSPEYGEDETPRYLIANLSAGYSFKVGKFIFNLKSGVENLFDKQYSTYSDWNNIPRKGRNVFINLGINF